MNASSSLVLRPQNRRRPELSASALGPALKVVRDLEQLPSCFLAQLLDTPLQTIASSKNSKAIELLLPPSGWLPLFSTPESLKKNLRSDSQGTPATLFIGDILAAFPMPPAFAGLVIDPGTADEFRLPTNTMSQLQEIQAAIAILSEDQLPEMSEMSESQEIASGTEMTIATPIPEPTREFVSLLTRELSSRRDLKAAYLFDLIQENDENRLTIGIVPTSKTEPDFQTFPDRLLETLSTHTTGVDELDLLILEDPELIDIVASTVSSLLKKKSA